VLKADREATLRARAVARPEEQAGLDARIGELTTQIAKVSSDLRYMGGEEKPKWVDDVIRQIRLPEPKEEDAGGDQTKIIKAAADVVAEARRFL
jgi:hypothetical protein